MRLCIDGRFSQHFDNPAIEAGKGARVPTILYIPLMSGSNAIYGIILVRAFLIASSAQTLARVALGFVAIMLATTNVVGGFVVTDRMLKLFKSRQPEEKARKER